MRSTRRAYAPLFAPSAHARAAGTRAATSARDLSSPRLRRAQVVPHARAEGRDRGRVGGGPRLGPCPAAHRAPIARTAWSLGVAPRPSLPE